MRIVLTNDDGIDAPGLLAARQTLEEIGDVITVAPDRNRSGVGRSITFGSTLHVEEREMADGALGYACTGTPVDCVRLVALGLMDFEPDIVVSGINHGENLGDDITYSGTVAGAMEGIVIGVPGIAVSLSIDRPWHESAEELTPMNGDLHFEAAAGRVGYDIYNNPPGYHEEDGTDFAAIADGEISVTPVHLELTDDAGLEEIGTWDVNSLLNGTNP